MAIKNNLLIAFMFWVFCGYSDAIAHPHPHSHVHVDHHYDQRAVVSPFDVKQKVRSLHCLLRGHADILMCPHSKAEGEKTLAIANECGGKTSGSIYKNILLDSQFAEVNVFLQCHYSSGSKHFQILLPALDRFIDSLDPPPIEFL
jgi:hypothetical protein